MQTNHHKILEEVNKVSIQLLLQEPFYGHFFSGLIKRVSSEIDTLAVGYHQGLVNLYINARFWQEDLAHQEYRYGTLKHEILHIVFKHIFRYKDFSNKTLFNIAADLVVNQYVRPDQLIEGAVLLNHFPELELEPHLHVEAYYNALKNLQEQFSNNKDPEAGKNNEAWKNLKNFLDQDHQNQKRHLFWGDLAEMSSAEKDLAEGSVNQAIENTLKRLKSKDFSNLPAGLQQYLKDFEQSKRAQLNWRRVLRLFTNSSRRTSIRNTLRRPSKRYGTNPGIKVKKRQKLLVAVDTSGSIDHQELQVFFNEIYHVWKQGTEIQVVECDTQIHKSYLYQGIAPREVSGGGGTSFEEPIRYANQEYRPDALIYFTDGYGAKPQIHPNCPILWMISQDGADLEYLNPFPGRKAKMS